MTRWISPRREPVGRRSAEHEPKPATPAKPSGHSPFLDALRGLASLWVVFNHLENFLPKSFNSIPTPLRVFFIEWGGLGVPFFFVISGFVIASSLRNVVMKAPQFGNFLVRRLLRLTPPYYAALALALVVSFVSTVVKDETFTAPTLGNSIAHLLYIPDLLKLPMINGVHWTLYLEVQFYVIFGITMMVVAYVGDHRGRTLQAAAVITGAAAILYPLFNLRYQRETYFLPYWHGFVLGYYIQWFVAKRLHIGIFATFFGLLGVAWAWHNDSLVGAAVVAGVIVLASTYGDRAQTWLNSAPFHFLGKISYSMYLTHSPVLGVIYFAGVKVLGDSARTELILIPFEVVGSIVAGWVAWRLVEKPSVEWSKALKRTS